MLIPLNLGVDAGDTGAWFKIALSIDDVEGLIDSEFTRGLGFTIYVRVGGRGALNRMRQGAGCDSGVIQVRL